MSSDAYSDSLRFDSRPRLQSLLGEWTDNLAQVFESLLGKRPNVSWAAVSGPAADALGKAEGPALWWEQPFQLGPDILAWAGAPDDIWKHLGNFALTAAGVEGPPPEEIHSTWLEILGQWFSAGARSISSLLEREVLCAPGKESTPPQQQQEWASISVEIDGKTFGPIAFAISPALCTLVAAEPTPQPMPPVPAGQALDESVQIPLSVRNSRTIDLLLDVELPVSISFGKTQLPLRDVLRLTTGSIVELNRSVNEPVEILVNHCLLARGEVVVVDGNYGVRIQQITSPQERLRSL